MNSINRMVPTTCCLYTIYYLLLLLLLLLLLWRCDPTRVMASSFLRFLDHTQRRTTIGRTPLDEWSACRRDLYLTTPNTHNRQTSMPPVGFELTISAGKRPQTNALGRAATGTSILYTVTSLYCCTLLRPVVTHHLVLYVLFGPKSPFHLKIANYQLESINFLSRGSLSFLRQNQLGWKG